MDEKKKNETEQLEQVKTHILLMKITQGKEHSLAKYTWNDSLVTTPFAKCCKSEKEPKESWVGSVFGHNSHSFFKVICFMCKWVAIQNNWVA